MAGKRIGLRDIAALEPGETRWDETLPGFGAHRQKSSAVSYVLFYRTMEASTSRRHKPIERALVLPAVD